MTNSSKVTEAARMASLRSLQVLDTSPEPVFDAIARTASMACATPIALVCLVDADRQWFKANIGLEDTPETGRGISFCTHAIEDSGVMNVANALADPRFESNVLVMSAPHIRAYAGAPIVLTNGAAVGTVCVIDRLPREFSVQQLNILRELAATSARALEMRSNALNAGQAEREGLERELWLAQRLASVAQHSDDAIVGKTLDSIVTSWNFAAERIFGYSAAEMIGKPITDIFPGDRIDEEAYLLAQVKAGNTVPQFETVRLRKDGSHVDVSVSLSPIRDSRGNIVAISKVARDISARKHQERLVVESEAKYKALVDDQSDLLALTLPDGSIKFANPAFAMFFGMTVGEVSGTSILRRAALEDRDAVGMELQRALASADAVVGENRWVGADGKQRWVSWTHRALRNSGGYVFAIHSVGRDITARRAMEESLRDNQLRLAEKNELLRVTLESIGDGVITTDAQGNVAWMNPVAERMTGWLSDEAAGRPTGQVFNILQQETREFAQSPVSRCLAEGENVALPGNTVLVSRGGGEYGIQDSASPIRSADGQILGAILVFRDVSEQRRLGQEMTFRAQHDELTGLINRSEFENRLGKLIQEAPLTGGAHSLLYMDLDQFKLVNDACGHAAGDLLLKQLASIFQSVVRSRDTLARLGGDEFGVLLEHCTVEQAKRVAEQICSQMEEFRFLHDGRRFRLGTSIGLVPVDARWTNVEAPMQAADSASYAAKEAGRNRVHVWYDTDQAVTVRMGQTQWGSRLENALHERRLELFGQRIEPLSATAKQGGAHVEVLLRLREDDGSLISPGAFLPAAERFHMATRIDKWVLKEVLSFLRDRASAGDIEMFAVNLSGQSVEDQEFHRYVGELLAGSSVDLRKLCFEITETSAITNLANATLFIEAMRKLGVRIALDDFGAGASSFGYLKSLSVDFLKIDGQFVRDLIEDPLDLAAVRCFTEVAKVVGVKTIAEFVERDELIEPLLAIGVDYVQGFTVHKPQPLAQAVKAYASVSIAA